jgi:hypothetical protein
MIRLAFLFFSFLFLGLAFTPASGSDIMEISWEDLVPPLPPEKNPLAGLSEEEAGFVEWIIYLRLFLPEEIKPENEEFHRELEAALPKLKADGIDIDLIIADRKFRNTAVNEELDGAVVKLSGYLLPLDLSGKKVSDFLLVPWIGACIHTPPPPPNQIVSAVSLTPTPFAIEKLFKPVTVTGRMKLESLSRELFLVDGSDTVQIGYSMRVDKIEEYQSKEPQG